MATNECLPWEKPLVISLHLPFFSFCKKCKTENQTDEPGTYWTTNHGKPTYAPLVWTQSQWVLCFEKSHLPSFPAGLVQSCLHKSANPTGEYHAPHTLPRTQSSAAHRQIAHPTPTKLNNTDIEYDLLLTAGMEWNAEPTSENGGGVSSQILSVGARWSTSAESGDGVRSQPPRAGAWWITELISWDCGWCTKLNCPILLGEELTFQSHSCGAIQLLPGKTSIISDQ
jgi:hypothetical protein